MVDAAYHREYYRKTRDRRLKLKRERQRERRNKLRDRMRAYKAERGCADCGETDPIVLTFDHTNDDKEHNPSDMVQDNYGWEKILAELEKCEVVR